uniref:STY4528 family pathogenicity island replication protein n=1 Tax=Marinobacterium profundum TaxID=1714300 RepID=UPI0008343AE7|nr:STY4528 family pathogenicity island replication protein [Marinobacterium profundum]
MAADDPSRHLSPVPLSDLFDGVLKQLAPTEQDATAHGDGILYSGNRHESVPRALFLDTRLTPLERNAWQVFRLLLNDHGVTTLPTYDQLRPYLASMPCGARASHETVARALTLLRLTRWLSLVRRRRDPRSGRILGNLYVLHDEPLTPFEAMQLDADYLGLVSQALDHAAKAVRTVGLNALKEIADDPLLSGRTLPTRLQVLAQRMTDHDMDSKHHQQDGAMRDSEEGSTTLLRNQEPRLRNQKGLASESEPGSKAPADGRLRNPKEDRTVSNSNNKIRIPRARAHEGLQLPERFTRLKDEQQAGVLVALQQLDETLQQAVLDEWDARCLADTIRNPAGYLFGIIQRALQGEFNAWLGPAVAASPTAKPQSPSPRPPPASSTPSRSKPKVAPPEVALEYLARLREFLRDS